MNRLIFTLLLICGTSLTLAAAPAPPCERVADQRYWVGPEGNAGLSITGKFTSLKAMADTLKLDTQVGEMNGDTWSLADILVRADFNSNGRTCVWLVSGRKPILAKYLQQLRKLSADPAVFYDFGAKDVCIRVESND
jgi:hypothetical protein